MIFPQSEVLDGFTMTSPLNFGNNQIYGVNDPVINKSAAKKQQVDNKKAYFSDGLTSTNVADLRNSVGNVGLFSDVTFHSVSYCQDIDSASSEYAIVTKKMLETGGFVGLNSFIPSIGGLLSKLTSQ